MLHEASNLAINRDCQARGWLWGANAAAVNFIAYNHRRAHAPGPEPRFDVDLA